MMYTLNNLPKMDLRSLSNILYSFVNISRKPEIVQNYFKFFKECQLTIAIHLRQNPKLSIIDLNQIIFSYSKSQTFNKEFLSICESSVIQNSSQMDLKSLANAWHSLQLNGLMSSSVYTLTIDHYLQKLEQSEYLETEEGKLEMSQENKGVSFRKRVSKYKNMKIKMSDEILLLTNIVERRMVKHKKYPGQDVVVAKEKENLTEKEIMVIDKVLGRFSVEHKECNFLDCKAVHKCLMHFFEYLEHVEGLPRMEIINSYRHVFNANAILFQNFALTLESNDLVEFFYGMEYVVDFESEESRIFVRDVKYMLKRVFRDGKISSHVTLLKWEHKKIKNEKIYKMFRRILYH